jgi:transcriptional regulator with XRE-family HTH domain
MNTELAFYKKVGEQLMEARKFKGLTQKELADRLELSRTSIANIEKGNQRLSLFYLYEIASKLDMSISELLISMDDFQAEIARGSKATMLDELLSKY